MEVEGNDNYKAMCASLAAEHGLEVTNPELQERIGQIRAELSGRRAEPGLAVTPRPQQRLPQPAEQPTLLNVDRYPMKDQYRFYNDMMDRLEAVGKVKVQRVAAKVAKRLERRETLARWSEADRPQKPQGLLAAFKKSEYDEAVKAYWQRQRRDRSLVEQATKLQKDVLVAIHRSENWAVRKLYDLQPEFVDRVKSYVRGRDQAVQMAELEARRKLQRERGIEGPERSR